MPRTSRPLRLLLLTALATCGLAGCGKRASDETATAGGKAGRSPDACPLGEQVSQAAGFQVTFMQSIGRDLRNPDTFMGCPYEMTGRYRGASIVLTGEPASKADSIYAEIKQSVKIINGQDAEADRIDVGSGGWAYGSDSKAEAAAVIGSHVYHAEFGDVSPLRSLGDQKDAMVRVLKLMAH